MMKNCIRFCRDCADICTITGRFLARGSKHAEHLSIECKNIALECAEECEKHASHYEHCRNCAEACRKCIEVWAND